MAAKGWRSNDAVAKGYLMVITRHSRMAVRTELLEGIGRASCIQQQLARVPAAGHGVHAVALWPS